MGLAPAAKRKSIVGSLQDEVRKHLANVGEPTPPFVFRIGFYDNYDALIQGTSRGPAAIEEEVHARAIQSGRLLLSGRGGTAKTEVMRRVAGITLQKGHLPVLIDLVRWKGSKYDEWNKLSRDSAERVDFLLRELAVPRTSARELDALPASLQRVVLVDGLNEVTSPVGDSIIEAFDGLVTFAANLSVIISDRLVRRRLPHSYRWLLASVLPLEADEIRRNLKEQLGTTEAIDQASDTHKALLSAPYFLDRVVRRKHPEFREYFLRHASLSQEELELAGRAAYTAYAETKTRSFSLATFEKNSSNTVVKKLREAGFLRVEGDIAYFDHHLKHDFLAALYVAASRDSWNRSTFDIVSFRASSYDCLALALQELRDSEAADQFVRQLYDWNPYSPAYAVAEALRHGKCVVSAEMQIVLLAMLAERRWDIMENTVQTATDAIHLLPTEDARAFAKAGSFAEIVDYVKRVKINALWFDEWRELFTRSSGSAVNDRDLDLIYETDSVKGWTFSNVLRRLFLTDDQQAWLRQEVRHENPTVRWRVNHVLGAKPADENVQALLERLDNDPDVWARRGAMRSIVESAARAEGELRRRVFDELLRRAPRLVADEPVIAVFKTAVFVDQAHAREDWLQLVRQVISKLFEASSLIEERDEWVRVADSLEAEYAGKEAGS